MDKYYILTLISIDFHNIFCHFSRCCGAWASGEDRRRHAYCCVMWGTNPGYALGAAVLGARLKELLKERGEDADLVLMHTDATCPRNIGDDPL